MDVSNYTILTNNHRYTYDSLITGKYERFYINKFCFETNAIH